MAINKIASSLAELGLTLDARAGRDGWAKLYLCDARGERLGPVAEFRSNKSKGSYLTQRAATAPPGCHLGRAVAEVAKAAPLGIVAEACFLRLDAEAVIAELARLRAELAGVAP